MNIRWSIKQNNRGAALILVIVCIAFATILGTSILYYSSTNRSMKTVDEKSTENFYSAESLLDEFVANLQKQAEDSLGRAYTKLIASVGNTDEGALRELVRNELFEKWTGEKYTDGKVANVNGSEWFGMIPSGADTSKTNVTTYVEFVKDSEKDPLGSLYIRNFSFSYLENSYLSTITTDVRVAVEFSAINLTTPVKTKGNYLDYAVIAADSLNFPKSSPTINGKIYSGQNIVISTEDVTLNSKVVYAKGEIQTKEKAKLTISGMADVWVNGIRTTRENAQTQSIDISGNCYLADDLTLDADNSEITIKDGDYYGYSKADSSNGSSVTINARGASLDMSKLKSLTIAGYNSLKIPKIYGVNEYSGVDEYSSGESLGFKGNQFTYLVPDEYINLKHNPITSSEVSSKDEIQVEGTLPGKEKPGDFFDSSNPFLIKEIKYTNTTDSLYYVYWNFSSYAGAKEYFVKSDFANNEASAYAKALNLKKVLLPSKVSSSGVYFSYDGSSMDYSVGNLDTKDSSMLTSIQNRNHNVAYFLDENSMGSSNSVTGESNTAIDNILRTVDDKGEAIDWSDKVYNYDQSYKNVGDNKNSYAVVVKNGNFTLDSNTPGSLGGIVICSGDVTVERNWKGLIIARGKVTVNAGVTLSDGSDFLEILLDENPEIQKYFLNYPYSGGDSGEGSDEAPNRNITISLENWLKN